MKRKYDELFLNQLVSNTKQHSIRVTCIDKTRVKDDVDRDSLQRLEFEDAQGSKMRASLFGVNVKIFGNIIKIGSTYDIANVLVKDTIPEFVPEGSLKKQLYITDSTDVVLVSEESLTPFVRPLRLDICALQEDYPTGKRVDLVAVVLHATPPKSVTLRRSNPAEVSGVYVTDGSSEKPLLISAWHDLAKKLYDALQEPGPVNRLIYISCLTSSTFEGFSLGSTMSTVFDLNLQCQRAAVVRQWLSMNESLVQERRTALTDSHVTKTPTEIIPIIDARSKLGSELTVGQIMKIKGKVSMFAPEALKITVSCKHCLAVTGILEHEDAFVCLTCSKVSPTDPKLYFRFKIRDTTGSLSLNAFNKQVEDLFQTTALALYSKTAQARLAHIEVQKERLCSTDTCLLIRPVTTILQQHNLVKWALKDVVA